MNGGHGEPVIDETGPAHYDGKLNEHGQLWHYRTWAESMAARDWDELREIHSRPEGIV